MNSIVKLNLSKFAYGEIVIGKTPEFQAVSLGSVSDWFTAYAKICFASPESYCSEILRVAVRVQAFQLEILNVRKFCVLHLVAYVANY